MPTCHSRNALESFALPIELIISLVASIQACRSSTCKASSKARKTGAIKGKIRYGLMDAA